jgi:hypothetical protein
MAIKMTFRIHRDEEAPIDVTMEGETSNECLLRVCREAPKKYPSWRSIQVIGKETVEGERRV